MMNMWRGGGAEYVMQGVMQKMMRMMKDEE